MATDISVEQLAVSLWNLLADGDPVTPSGFAARSGVDEALVNDALRRWPGIFRDDESRVVGFAGLAISPMDRRFNTDGGKPIYAWCALDPLLIVFSEPVQ